MEERDEINPALPDEQVAEIEADADTVSWHFLVFTTNKGHVTIDWHNDSNGYYDGSVMWSVRELTPRASPVVTKTERTKGGVKVFPDYSAAIGIFKNLYRK